MSLTPADQNDLVIPLFEGLFEAPLWGTFLRRLLARTGAQRVRLTLRNAAAPSQPPLHLHAATGARRLSDGPGLPDPFDGAAYAALRPGRVYALADMRDFGSSEARARQDEALARAAVGDARLIRMTGGGNLEAWVALLHEREAFAAADSALLTSLVPAVAAAMATLATLGTLSRRAQMAEEALGLLGIGQAAFDCEGRAVVEDDVARAELGYSAAGAQDLARACAELAEPGSRTTMALGPEARTIMLRPIPPANRSPADPAVAVAVFRRPAAAESASATKVIAETLGLSAREAALAEAMSRGLSIIDAGRALRLTPETARNYSKRIYAKTGASGQADLVRLILTGLAPLA